MRKKLALEKFDSYMTAKGWNARPQQRESIEKIADYYESGSKVVVYTAPTGSGKSQVLMAAAAGCESAYYVVCNLSLQDQILNDFDCVRDIRGRGNYKCSMLNENCADGLCQRKKHFKCEMECGYKAAKAAAVAADIVVSNIWYFILEGGRNFGKRELLIIDEAHNLPELLVQFSRVVISGRSATKGIWESACEYYDENLESEEFVRKAKGDIDGVVDELEDWDELEELELKTLKRLRGLSVRLENCLLAGDIVTERKEWTIEVVPLKAKTVAQRLIFDRADKVLLASATINPYNIANELDTRRLLGSGSLAHFSTPCIFPKENRPIFCMSVCNFSYKNQTLENTLKLGDAVAEIVDIHPDEKGIILLNAYKYSEMLEGVHPRLVFHDRKDRKKKFAAWLGDFSDKVFVGVGFGEGVDLAYDKARFSIVMKSPASSIADIRVKARLERKDWVWYNNQTKSNLVQAAGRIVRADDDRGEMWILDAAAIKLIKQKSVPSYIREAIIDVNYDEWLKEKQEASESQVAEIWKGITSFADDRTE